MLKPGSARAATPSSVTKERITRIAQLHKQLPEGGAVRLEKGAEVGQRGVRGGLAWLPALARHEINACSNSPCMLGVRRGVRGGSEGGSPGCRRWPNTR
eukprot:847864-Prorocentrum_minimum.AAC.3